MSNEDLQLEITNLKQKISVIENNVNQNIHLPSTNLLSDKFLTRAFAVLGHYLVAGLIIVLPIYLLIFLLVLLGS